MTDPLQVSIRGSNDSGACPPLSELKLLNIRTQLSQCRSVLGGIDNIRIYAEPGSRHVGLVIDHFDVQIWLLRDSGTDRWLGIIWERGLFARRAAFSTPSLTDAVTFFAAWMDRPPGLFDGLRRSPDDPAVCYADALSLNAAGQFDVDMRLATKIIAQRLNQQSWRINFISTAACDLISSTARLFRNGDHFRLEKITHESGNAAALFADLHTALKAFITVSLKRSVVTPEPGSLLQSD